MMPFKRKPGLGHYNEPRETWYDAYRVARVAIGKGLEPDHNLKGVRWKAQLIVAFDRNPLCDKLRFDAKTRLGMMRMHNEIMADIGAPLLTPTPAHS